jgi:hypothetical protein
MDRSAKKPLLENRDSILSELKEANGKLSELGQRLSETENTLMSEKAVTSKYLIDTDLTALLKNANVFDEVIPHTIENLKATYSLSVKADDDNRKAIGILKDGDKDFEAELPDIIADWSVQPISKCLIKNTNSGGRCFGKRL